MPLYVSECRKCGCLHEYVKTIDRRHETPFCCGDMTVKILTPVGIGACSFSGYKGFHMPDANSTWIEDGAAYKKYMRENNKIPHDEHCQEVEHQRKQNEAINDRKLTADVEKALAIHS